MIEVSRANLDLVFGATSQGATAEARATTSNVLFVRSQVQLAIYADGATGRIINAIQALKYYGFDALYRVVVDGYVPLVSSRHEPARTIERRRGDLNLTTHAVSISSGVPEAVIERAEKPGTLTSVHALERIAQALALDERQIGVISGARADNELGVRLRESHWQGDTSTFSERSVSDLAEAAWVVARQSELMKDLPSNSPSPESWRHLQSHDYSYKTWQKGYDLAARARRFFGLSNSEPIESLRSLIDNQLRIPLVQLAMHERLAGATIANGDARGIVVNERGRNANVWVRRMTLAHEVGHLIGDPDDRLNKLRVDDYDSIERGTSSQNRDVVEMRANGFAVAFLAPPEGVANVVDSLQSDYERLREVVKTYGISKTAARYHILNVCNLDIGNVQLENTDNTPEDHWTARENATIDFFPWAETPISRRGLFTAVVTRSEKAGLITPQTAAEWLRVELEPYIAKRDRVELYYN